MDLPQLPFARWDSLGALGISKGRLDQALKAQQNPVDYHSADQRGKNKPANKTRKEDVDCTILGQNLESAEWNWIWGNMAYVHYFTIIASAGKNLRKQKQIVAGNL